MDIYGLIGRGLDYHCVGAPFMKHWDFVGTVSFNNSDSQNKTVTYRLRNDKGDFVEVLIDVDDISVHVWTWKAGKARNQSPDHVLLLSNWGPEDTKEAEEEWQFMFDDIGLPVEMYREIVDLIGSASTTMTPLHRLEV